MAKILRKFHHLLMWPLCALFILIGPVAVQAETYYVDRTLPGSNSNNGTETTPFLTIQKCVSVVGPGDICLVKNGIYTEPVFLTRSGVEGSPITLKNYPGHTPVIDGTRLLSHGVSIGSDFVTPSATINYVTFEGFTVQNAYLEGIKMGNAAHVVVRNNTIRSPGGSGILAWGFDVTVDRNSFIHCGSIPKGAGPQTGYALYITGQDWKITNNLVYDTNGVAFHLKQNAYDPAVSPNANYGGFGNALIANNTIAYSLHNAIIFYTESAAPGNGTGNIVRNNIFYQNNTAGTSISNAISWYYAAPGVTLVDHNVAYSTYSPILLSSAPNMDFTVFSNSSGGNGEGTNPNFVNAPLTLPQSPDFHLTTDSSVALNAGVNLTSYGITTDNTGNIRPASDAWEIGAYELSGNAEGLISAQNVLVQ